MKQHPINDILKTSLDSMGNFIDVNKVIGEPMIISNDIIAIPLSKVIYGYGVGGSQFINKYKKEKNNLEMGSEIYPFGGASGGGITLKPQALIIIKKEKIQLINIDKESDTLPKILDVIKEIFTK